MITMIGRMGLSLTVGGWLMALWALAVGVAPILSTRQGGAWWPGSLYSFVLAGVTFGVFEYLPGGRRVRDLVHRSLVERWVVVWAAAGALVLFTAAYLRWDRVLEDGLAAIELLALGLAGLAVAGLFAPAPEAGPVRGLPALRAVPGAAGEGEEREFIWEAERSSYRPTEPNHVVVRIDYTRLREQREGAHGLSFPRWGQYAVLSPEVAEIARQLREISSRRGYDKLDELRLVLGFVTEGLGSATAEEGAPLYPLETLTEEQPGRVARTVLAAAIMAALGYRPALLQAGDRVAIAVAGAYQLPDLFLSAGGEPALFAELAREGAHCGDVPADSRTVPWQMAPVRV